MNVSVVVIGDELLIGQVTDTNSGWIARHLNPLGWNVKSVKVVADVSDEIIKAIEQAFETTDIVLTTGGLGPTKDDITKSTLCKYFGGELVLDAKTLKNVEEIIAKRHLSMNVLNEGQAMVPSSCKVIQNQVGTAPIMWFEKGDKVLVAMPGVPFEMETMMKREVIPQLLRHYSIEDHIEHRVFIVIGYAESALAIKLDKFEQELPEYIHLAYLPKPGIVRLRLTGVSRNPELLNRDMTILTEKLDAILGNAIISHEDKSVSSILGDRLRELNLTVSTAESCTGGNVAHQITSVAGSSVYYVGSVISYSNEVKHNLLKVPEEMLITHGAVSEPVVRQMAQGVCDVMRTECAMATSGIAGPGGGTDGKPVGTVWMAVKVKERIECKCMQFPGVRERVIERATTEVQLMLLRLLMK